MICAPLTDDFVPEIVFRARSQARNLGVRLLTVKCGITERDAELVWKGQSQLYELEAHPGCFWIAPR